jgi:hypothetical protein
MGQTYVMSVAFFAGGGGCSFKNPAVSTAIQALIRPVEVEGPWPSIYIRWITVMQAVHVREPRLMHSRRHVESVFLHNLRSLLPT